MDVYSLHTLTHVGLWFVLGMGCPERLHRVRSRTHGAVARQSMFWLEVLNKGTSIGTIGIFGDSKSRTLRNSELLMRTKR